MKWTNLRDIITSKAYWSLNLLLIAVPLIARFGLEASWDLFALYIAAFLIFAAGLIFHITIPKLCSYKDYSDYMKAGLQSDFLSICVGKYKLGEKLSGDTLRSINASPTNDSFWEVQRNIDSFQFGIRFTISVLLGISILLVAYANVIRFDTVISQLEGVSIMKSETVIDYRYFSQHLIGKDIKVWHEDGVGGVEETEGPLINPNDDGDIVVEDKETREIVRIPKPRVIKTKQPPFDDQT